MIKTENFISAYYATRKNKRRSGDSVRFEVHCERNLMRLMDDLRNHTFNPSTYTFIVPNPRPREVFACDMSLRIVDHYLEMKLNPYLERELSPRTFNNRVGMGGIVAVNQAISDIYEVSHGYTTDAWLIKMDLRGYFPNAVQDIVYQQLSDLLERNYQGEDKDLLRYMLLQSVFRSPTRGCVRKSPSWMWKDYPKEKSLFSKPDGIGGAIGRLIWQISMNYYLNDLDHWIIDECGLHFCRFVDDMLIVTDNKEGVLSLIPEIRRRLEEKGCCLHPKKFYCQHYSKGMEFIGTIVKRERVYVSSRTVRNFKKAVLYHNRHIRARDLESFLSSINSYLGIFKGRNAHRIAMKIIDTIDDGWYRYCHLDEARMCMIANDGYTHREMLSRKYNLKFKKNGNKRTNRTS